MSSNYLPPIGIIGNVVKQAVKKTSFYQNKYIGFSLEPFTENVFHGLPPLDKDEFYTGNTNGTLNNDSRSNGYIFVENGNLEVKKTTFWNLKYFNRQINILKKVFVNLGLTKNSRILNLLLPGVSGTYFIFNSTFEKIGSNIVPLGEESELSVIDYFANELQINTLIGKLEKIMDLIKFYEKLERNLFFESIFLVGELPSQDQIEIIHKYAKKISFPVYFSIETGIIGFQCPHLPIGFFHLSDTVYTELYDSQSQYKGDLREGKLVVTSLIERTSPLLKYQTDDQIKLHNFTCPCGNSAPIISLEQTGV